MDGQDLADAEELDREGRLARGHRVVARRSAGWPGRPVQLADQAHVAEDVRVAGEVDAAAGLQLDDEARRLAEIARRSARVVPVPAEWSADVIVTPIPRASTVPPLFIPITSSGAG